MSHFEIFILNYNGASLLAPCLDSLSELNIQDHIVGVNVIDNGSSDNSRVVVEKYPNFNFISLGKNLGFSKGNNRGVQIRLKQLASINKKPDYLLFLNNDTTVDSSMISAIDQTFTSDSEIGVVGLKSLFMDDYIALSLDAKLKDDQYVDIEVEGDNLGQDSKRYRVYKGTHLGEHKWRLRNNACLFIPVVNPQIKSNLIIRSNSLVNKFSVFSKFYRSNSSFVKESLNKVTQPVLGVDAGRYVKLIQNAGSFVTKNFEAGDLGSFEIDSGQYSEDRELSAVCGVAMTIKTDLFLKLSGFDENFFAYYEDTDLSLRAKRVGYKCYYSAKAMINHIHAGSSGVKTNYFIFNTRFSRLYFLSRFAPASLYQQLFREIKFNFRNEFELYLRDGVVENKANLRTYARYLRLLTAFYRNRFLKIFYRKIDKKISANFLQEKYVNEY